MYEDLEDQVRNVVSIKDLGEWKGVWLAQLVKHVTLDLRVMSSSPIMVLQI